jgi:hypothetical protein
VPDPIVLYGTRSDGSTAPVQIDSAGRVRINGLGEKGDKGDKGDQGDPGEGGEPGGAGAAATVAVGTVTTGEAGSAASVTNSGTSSDAVLDFTIPRGPARDNSGQQVFPTNGAASTSPVVLSGTWFTGGTATTTKPQFLIEPAGTTSNNYNTAGTGFGVNAPAGFAGDLAWLGVGGTGRFKISATQATGFSQGQTEERLACQNR